MTPQQIEALKLALEALEEIALAGMSGTGQESDEAMTAWHARQAWSFIGIAARALEPIKEVLKEHAMRETQRLGQEIEPKIGCVNHDCDQCKAQPEQEPVACKTLCELCVKRGYTFCANAVKTTHIYTTPPQRTEQEPVAYYLPHKGFYWAKPTSISAPTIADVEPLPLYASPPQRTEQCNYPDCKCPTENPCLKGLAQTQEPVQKPVAVVSSCTGVGDKGVRVKWLGGFPQIGDRLYFHPPQRKPLTDEEKNDVWEKHHATLGGWDYGGDDVMYYRHFEDAVAAIEAAHGIKENTND